MECMLARTWWCQTQSLSSNASVYRMNAHSQGHGKRVYPVSINLTNIIPYHRNIYLRRHLKPRTSEWIPTAFLETLTDTISGLPTERQFEMNLQGTLRRSKSEQLQECMALMAETRCQEGPRPLKNSSLLCPLLRSIGGNCLSDRGRFERK